MVEERLKYLEQLNVKLKNCPFCGSEMDLSDPDCLYPAIPAEYNEETGELEFKVWRMCCLGGCGGELLGDSMEECIRRWNIRYN